MKTSDKSDSLEERLNLNVVSIIIGALFFLMLACWVETIRTACNSVINDSDEDRYYLTKRKVWSSCVVSLIAIFIAILVYCWYQHKVDFLF